MQHSILGLLLLTIIIEAEKIKMNRSGRAKGEINIGHDSGLIEYDQMIEGLCKKKRV